ncbi:heme exporter protein CcmD [Pontixanthobacter sp. CEM42]|nr:heme exporter protein CcmD [Pontixanthobacter sp. CEM42]
MRENLPQWDFVIASYAVGIVAVLALVAWSWASMRKAEKRREEVKRK